MLRSRRLVRQFSKMLGYEDAEAVFLELKNVWMRRTLSWPTFMVRCWAICRAFLTASKQFTSSTKKMCAWPCGIWNSSSGELNDANFALEELNIAINAMLDTLGQGLLFFDEKGVCSDVFSRACLTL